MQNQRTFCDACEEITPVEIVSGTSRCTICGASVSNRSRAQQTQTTAPTNNNNNSEEAPRINLFEAFANGSTVSRGASSKALERLTRIKPDPRAKTILEPRVRIEVEGIEGNCLGVPASFGPIRNVDGAPLKLCEPKTAHLSKLNCELVGSVAVVERGGNVSFVHKAKVCQDAGAVAMLVIQTFDVWPFTPGDSSRETEQLGGIHIPVVAINKILGQRLVQHLQSTDKSIQISMTLCGGEGEEKEEEICAICHDPLIDEEDIPKCDTNEEEAGRMTVIMQMPCLHYYHEDCLMPWLKSNNTCPTCRFGIESENPLANEEMRTRLLQRQDTGLILGWFG